MENYPVVIDVQANTAAEARAKIDLLIQMGTFFSDFNLSNLADAFVKFQLLSCAGRMVAKIQEEKKQTSKALFQPPNETFNPQKTSSAV